jgi:murein DD-endopeptidase MepM/ murein hydrolase activator NlpD
MRWEDIDPDLKKDGRLIRKLIKAGQILGLPGDVMGCQGQKGGIHLHFEVRKKFIDSSGKEIWMWVDPYGLYATDDSELYPPLWLPGE